MEGIENAAPETGAVEVPALPSESAAELFGQPAEPAAPNDENVTIDETNPEVTEEPDVTDEPKEKEEDIDFEQYSPEEIVSALELDEDMAAELIAAKEEFGLTNEEMIRYNELNAIQLEKRDQALNAEFEKLSPEEQHELPNLYKEIQSFIPEGSGALLDSIFSTAEGVRFVKQVMNSMNQELPDTNSMANAEPSQPFTMTDYQNYVEQINVAGNNLDFQKVDALKAEMAKEIKARGSQKLKQDLSHFL